MILLHLVSYFLELPGKSSIGLKIPVGFGFSRLEFWLSPGVAVRPPGLAVRPVLSWRSDRRGWRSDRFWLVSSSGVATVFLREVKVMSFSAYVLHDACFD